EIVFHAPLGHQIFRNFHLFHLTAAVLHAPDVFVGEIVKQRAAIAENSQTIIGRAGMDAAELEHAFGAVFENAKHIEHVGNDHLIPAPLGGENFPAGEHPNDITEPALHHFDVDPKGEHVQSTDL